MILLENQVATARNFKTFKGQEIYVDYYNYDEKLVEIKYQKSGIFTDPSIELLELLVSQFIGRKCKLTNVPKHSSADEGDIYSIKYVTR